MLRRDPDYADTGGAINPGFITPLFFLEGLAVKGNSLFVANNFSTVGKYDAKTGAAINPSVITGLSNHFALARLLSFESVHGNLEAFLVFGLLDAAEPNAKRPRDLG